MSSLSWTYNNRRFPIGLSAVQVAPFPAIGDEPVSVADVLRHLRWFAGHPDEPSIPGWIATARAIIERETRIALAEQTWDLFLDEWGAVPGWIPFPLWPVISVDEIAVINDDETETVVPLDNYWSNLVARPARLVFGTVTSLDTARALAPIRIRYTAGFSDPLAVPVDLVHALLMQVAELAVHRGDEREPFNARTVAMGVDALIHRHKPQEVA